MIVTIPGHLLCYCLNYNTSKGHTVSVVNVSPIFKMALICYLCAITPGMLEFAFLQ